MADEFAFKKENAKDIAGIERMIAQARHITDPNIDLVQNGDGTYMRYDKRAGKSLGVLTDPETGKPFVGAKDVSKATLEVAQSMAKEGIELMKDTTNPEAREEGRRLLEQSRLMIIGGKGVESVAAKSARVFGGGKPNEEAKTQASAPSAGPRAPSARQSEPASEPKIELLSKAGKDGWNVKIDGKYTSMTTEELKRRGIHPNLKPTQLQF